MIQRIIFLLKNNSSLKLLLILILLDVIFGILRSIKERCSNSCIGIDGIIRKTGMIISIIFFMIIDDIVDINLFAFLPEEITKVVAISKVGISEVYCILYILFETLSILKNMYRCQLPVIKRLNGILEKILKEFTSEIKQ